MTPAVLIDTGPLISFLIGTAQHHHWAVEQWKHLSPPLYTCEAVLTEAGHLLRRENRATDQLLELIELGVLKVEFALQNETLALRQLIRRYRDVRMSIADACLVRMTEIRQPSTVLTTDSDFQIYRRNGRHVIPVIMPYGD